MRAQTSARTGRPKGDTKKQTGETRGTAAGSLAAQDEGKQFRIQSTGVLLTYSGVKGLEQWRRFVAHVRAQQKQWKVKYWCATLEACKEGGLHLHLFLQFTSVVDKRTSRTFAFETLTPRADCNDLLGNGFSRKKLQESLNQGFFYCWADKVGTQRDEQGAQCTEGNYFPCWTGERCAYKVSGRWPQSLWQAHKLTHGLRRLPLCLPRRRAPKKEEP